MQNQNHNQEAASEQADLRGGLTPWRAPTPSIKRSDISADFACDTLIVGAGITGSMMAAKLSSEGREVCVIDREKPGRGSTAASTAMLLWEIDQSLSELTDVYGFERAARIYQRSFRTVQKLRATLASLALPCAFAPRESLYLAAEDIGARELRAENELRGRAKLPSRDLDYTTLLGKFGIVREAALFSPGCAEADPRQMAQGFLQMAITRGAQMFDAEAVRYHSGGKRAAVELDSGRMIEAQHVVLATGYVLPDIVTSDLHSATSSWAIATASQQPEMLWPHRALIWEASKNYLYARSTFDNRIIVGGEDDKTLSQHDRDLQALQKAKILQSKLRDLWPATTGNADMVWSGAFGVTKDGLPLLGKVPGHPCYYAAYGYGGNGITFSFLASEIIGSLIRGEQMPWFDDFAIDRSP